MEKLYLLTIPNNDKNHYVFGSFIREDQYSIDLMWVKETKYYNHNTFSLSKALMLCTTKKGIDLKDYFFTDTSSFFRSNYKDGLILPLKFSPGNYFPRIYRPIIKTGDQGSNIIKFRVGRRSFFDIDSKFDYIPYEERSLISGVQQLKILIDKLQSIFRHVYPDAGNWSTFSDEIRNLIILACTEVEAQWKGILRANGVLNDKLTTNDYVKLLLPLRLSGYSIQMGYFPSIRFIQPFRLWDVSNPTKSLDWYDAYNHIKHDREKNFEKATLENAVKSVSAVAVLLAAQYGYNIPYWKDIIGNFFEFVNTPSWNFDDCYLPPIEGRNWIRGQYTL